MTHTYNSTLIDAIADLQTRGYSSDFVLMDDKLFCAQQKIFLKQEEFDINEMYSFQQDDARQGTVLYGIESEKHAIKGILLSQLSRRSTSSVPDILLKKIGKFWI